jgi:hypothetical protein
MYACLFVCLYVCVVCVCVCVCVYVCMDLSIFDCPQALAAYEAFFQADVARAVETCSTFFREEEKWTVNWLKMVSLLKE